MATPFDEHAILEVVKKKWILEFGSLQHELGNVSGYFIAGFLADALREYQPEQPAIMDFKVERVRARLTLREVEKETGLSNAYLSQIENGIIKNPSFNTIKKLTDFYQSIITKHNSL